MKINNFKHSIWRLLFSLIILFFTVIMLIVMAIHKEIVWIIISVLFFAIAVFATVISLQDVQWYSVENSKIVVNNIFGIVKEVEYVDIKKSFIINATILSIKMARFNKPYIVLAINKSCQKGMVQDAYNRKKNRYIIIPYNEQNELLIKSKYKASTGRELIL